MVKDVDAVRARKPELADVSGRLQRFKDIALRSSEMLCIYAQFT